MSYGLVFVFLDCLSVDLWLLITPLVFSHDAIYIIYIRHYTLKSDTFHTIIRNYISFDVAITNNPSPGNVVINESILDI